MRIDISLDLETLDTEQTGIILSIGAAIIYPDEGLVMLQTGFYSVLDRYEQAAIGRTQSDETVTWWDKQSAEAKQVFEEKYVSVRDGLCNFTEWLDSVCPEHGKRYVWANSPSFDCSMLKHLYAMVGLQAPWNFRNERDYRTIMELAGLDKIKPKVAHNALADAAAQASHISRALAILRPF